MRLFDTLQSEVDRILGIDWQLKDANVIPEAEEIVLANCAFKIEATFLYAYLADVMELAEKCTWETTAKIIRAYSDISARMIFDDGGTVRRAGSDSVMGIFSGKHPIHRQ
jgi:class 3 adenylate cyclase